MPWKGEKDPYRIWLSEIILQQTRVEQGLKYYNSFIAAFPDIHSLAKAPDEKVFKLWEGLGYYSRCRNLLWTARYISRELNGRFPENHGAIRSLKGIGPYTAAAISSFAFNLPYAVVDGNVYRVLARVFGIASPTDTTEGKKHFAALANTLLDKSQPGVYNQAIMDFGAMICKPAAPLCTTCIFSKKCVACRTNKVEVLPVKQKKTVVRQRWFYYLILEHRGKVAIHQRNDKDIWQGLFQFPLLETDDLTNVTQVIRLASKKKWLAKKEIETLTMSPLRKQQLSHQLITGQFIRIQLSAGYKKNIRWQWVSPGKLAGYPFPRFITQHLETAVYGHDKS